MQQPVEDLTPEERGLQIGLRIHRRHDTREWRALVDGIVDERVRNAAALYLRGIGERMRTLKGLKGR